MLLIALVFDASPLFVPALGLLIAGGWRPPGCGRAPAARRVRRELRADRVIEDEPLTATIVVRRGRLGLPGAEVADPFTGARLELSGPLSPFTGDREARVRVVSRFPRRGRVHARAAGAARHRPARARPASTRAGAARRSRCSCSRAPSRALAGRRRRTAGLRTPTATPRPRRSPPSTSTACGPTGPAPRPAASTGRPSPAAPGLIERRLSADSDTRPLVVLDTRGSVPAWRTSTPPCGPPRRSRSSSRARGGCGLLLPGEQRATTIDRDLIAWPAVYARLAIVPGGPTPAPPVLGRRRRPPGAMIYVAAQAPERLLREPGRRAGVVLVVPARALRDGRPAAGPRAVGPAVLEVCGCRGFVLGAGREREAPRPPGSAGSSTA